MNEKEFLTKEILINERVENIFRSIEAQILKEAMSNFAQRPEEIAGLEKFMEKIDELKGIYTNERRQFTENLNELKRNGLDSNIAQGLHDEFNRIIIDLDTYKNMLGYMRKYIENSKERLRDEKNKNQIKDILENMHSSYNDYLTLNRKINMQLEAVKTSLK